MARWIHRLLLISALGISILAHYCSPFPGDITILEWLRSWQHPAIRAYLQAVSVIGKSVILVGLAGVTATWLFAQKRRLEGATAIGMLLLLLVTPILQLSVGRSRPSAGVVGADAHAEGWSFPSGHAYQSLVLFGFLVFLACVMIECRRLRRFVQLLMFDLILSIGVSRVYLGAHWPSDVLGAYLLGGAFLAYLIRWYQNKVSTARSHQGQTTCSPIDL